MRLREITDQVVKGEDLSSRKLGEIEYTECTFTNCDFSESDLRNTRFTQCIFKNCNLSLCNVEGCRFQDVQFIESKCVGIDFHKCDRTFFSIKLHNSFAQYCNFSDLNMKRASFSGSKLLECHFANTNLQESRFDDSHLSGSIFHDCDLRKANFTGAIGYAIDPQTNNIKKAKFTLPDALSLLSRFDVTIT